jgi:acetylornithine/N-succinyldiaminopimelate aminotransferase
MVTSAELVALAQSHLYSNYRQPPIVLVRGQGVDVWDADGRKYLDLCAGIAVDTLGHAHPQLVARLAAQAGQLMHVSNYFYNEPNIRLAVRLTEMTGYARALFCNSGTEAIEALLKLARRNFFVQGHRDRYRVIAFDNSFHGRTLGALAATGQTGYREGFGPLMAVTHVPYGDTAAVRAQMGPDVAAILVEAVQGEGGVVPARPGFLADLRELCDESGALLLADEVQTGMGRTGRLLAFEHQGVRADAVAIAKGLGGGFPIGAMLCTEALAKALPPGSHGTTFGGNALASTAALTVLEVLESDGLVAAAERKGHLLAKQLGELGARHPQLVETTRGLGLLQAVVLRASVDARVVLDRAREAGLLLTLAGGAALRITPALTITEAELADGVRRLDAVFGELSPCPTC